MWEHSGCSKLQLMYEVEVVLGWGRLSARLLTKTPKLNLFKNLESWINESKHFCGKLCVDTWQSRERLHNTGSYPLSYISRPHQSFPKGCRRRGDKTEQQEASSERHSQLRRLFINNFHTVMSQPRSIVCKLLLFTATTSIPEWVCTIWLN